MKHVIAGNGGVGSRLVELLIRVVDPRTLVLVDKDKLEPKNLDRQLFDEDQVGMSKSVALAAKYKLDDAAVDEWFSSSLDLGIASEDFIFCCCDNAAAMRETLIVCDEKDCRAVIAANEYTDAEAYWYERSMKDTPNDPRVFYPSILTDRSGDPLGPPGCQGEAQQQNRQLVLANAMAADLAALLFWFHARERPDMDVEDKPNFPVMYKFNLFGPKAIKWGTRQ